MQPDDRSSRSRSASACHGWRRGLHSQRRDPRRVCRVGARQGGSSPPLPGRGDPPSELPRRAEPITTGCSTRRAGSATSGPSSARPVTIGRCSCAWGPGPVAYQLGGTGKWALGVQTKRLSRGTIPECPRLRQEHRRSAAVVSRGSERNGGPEPLQSAELDAESRRWVEQLRAGHPRHHQTVARFHAVLQRVAMYELSRRRPQLRTIRGPEFDDLAQQAADDALVNVLDRLDEFRGLSRFTTWAYTFVMFEVSAKVAGHAWRRQPPDVEQLAWDQLPDPVAVPARGTARAAGAALRTFAGDRRAHRTSARGVRRGRSQ